MFNEATLKCFCVLTLLGLTAGAPRFFNASSIDFAALTEQTAFWNNIDCADHEDGARFPHPQSCKWYLICDGGELKPGTCEVGELFNPIYRECDPEDEVTCLEIPDPTPDPTPPGDDLCPPPGSNEVRFLPSEFCDSYYICMNGQFLNFSMHIPLY